MTRSHSKNAHTQSIFSGHERAQIRRQTASKRLGAESFKPFDSCNLCLATLVAPVSCPRGHMYCRECALANLVSQKAGIAAQRREMERWEAGEAREKEDARRRARERVVADFEKGLGLSVGPARGTGAGAGAAAAGSGSGSGSGSRTAQTSTSTSTPTPAPTPAPAPKVGGRIGMKVDDAAIEQAARAAELKAIAHIEAEQAEARRSKLAAFWLPSLAPEAKTGPVQDIKLQTQCHYGGEAHPFSLKTLLPVQLHYPTQSKTPHCPSCARELSNAVPSVLLSSREPIGDSAANGDAGADADADGERPSKKAKSSSKPPKDKPKPYVCGHVVCKTCADTIVRPARRCCVCEAGVKEDGMIPVGTDGTGFAAAGGAEVKDSNAIVFRMG